MNAADQVIRCSTPMTRLIATPVRTDRGRMTPASGVAASMEIRDVFGDVIVIHRRINADAAATSLAVMTTRSDVMTRLDHAVAPLAG